MKKIILTASLISGLLIVVPAIADEAHHPGKPAASAPAPARMETAKVDPSLQQMQEMRKKIETTKDPASKKELMHQHMQMMRNGMKMMGMMGGQEGGMMAEKDAPAMPMADRMAMMEKKMVMMEKMMGQGGGMMGGMAAKPMDDKTAMLEKKMLMMEEMLNGMMLQQEMLMK